MRSWANHKARNDRWAALFWLAAKATLEEEVKRGGTRESVLDHLPGYRRIKRRCPLKKISQAAEFPTFVPYMIELANETQ